MTTPSTVSAERILLLRSVSNAMPTISREQASPHAPSAYSFRQRFDRIEAAPPACRIQAEEQADERR